MCWFVQRTSCELHVLCLSGTLLSVTPCAKDLTCRAIGLYADRNNKIYVVYFFGISASSDVTDFICTVKFHQYRR
jgi:hypothetical protein